MHNYENITATVELLKDSRQHSEEKFKAIFKAASDMTKLHGRPSPVIPRQTGRQTQCSNLPAATPEDYWRCSVFIPFLDTLIAELDGRFSSLSKKAVQALLLLPKNLASLTDIAIDHLHDAFQSDLPDSDHLSLRIEVERWRKKWVSVSPEQLPTSMKALVMESVNPKLFPNITWILHLLLVIPVTSANVERANSSLKFIKTDLRSTMSQDRLNALLLLYIHQAIPLDVHAVADRFARAHPRLMLFINPMSES